MAGKPRRAAAGAWLAAGPPYQLSLGKERRKRMPGAGMDRMVLPAGGAAPSEGEGEGEAGGG